MDADSHGSLCCTVERINIGWDMDVSEANRRAADLANAAWADTDRWDACYRDAIGLLRPFAERSDATAETLTNFGALLSDHGRHREAIAVLRRALALNQPPYRNTLFNLAVALMNTGEVGRRKAMDMFERARGLSREGDPTIEAYFDAMAY